MNIDIIFSSTLFQLFLLKGNHQLKRSRSLGGIPQKRTEKYVIKIINFVAIKVLLKKIILLITYSSKKGFGGGRGGGVYRGGGGGDQTKKGSIAKKGFNALPLIPAQFSKGAQQI